MEKFPLKEGQRFGKLVIIKLDHTVLTKQGRHRYYYLCKCDCGNTHTAEKSHLKGHRIISCGCWQKSDEYKQTVKGQNSKHGMKGTRLYYLWSAMKERCNTPSCSPYKRYGGRGITYCEEWEKFEPFMEWALNNGYNDNLSIDRIDPDGNYEPSNCRWVSWKVQGNNRSNNRVLTYKGESHTISEWAQITGIKSSTIQARLRRGCTIEEVLETPVDLSKSNRKKRKDEN